MSPRTVFPLHSRQPAEFVIPNGGGFGSGACPLKLKKMAHMHRDRKRIVACSACAVAQNQRTHVNVDCGRQTYCVVYGTQEKREKKSQIFIIRKQNSSFGNSHSNLDFVIITNNSGGLAAMPLPSAMLILPSFNLTPTQDLPLLSIQVA